MSGRITMCAERLNLRRNFALCMVPAIVMAAALGCSRDPPAPAVKTAALTARAPRRPVVESPTMLVTSPVHVKLTAVRGAQLYIPPWFRPKRGGYDLIVHFHGLGKIQEANIERAQLNVAVVSINLGAGTTPYAKPFRNRETFANLLAEAQSEIASSGRAPNARLRRLALSAWSAGYVSIAKVMSDPEVAQKVDAVLLADGFFTSFTNLRKRTVNEAGIAPFARFADAASRDEKLFAITHTTIPTGPFPSLQECVAKLLEMSSVAKVPSSTIGPREMHEIYLADSGSFHVKGYEGRTAGDHVRQIHAMGETLYPYLKARWDEQDAEQREGESAAKNGVSDAAPRSSP